MWMAAAVVAVALIATGQVQMPATAYDVRETYLPPRPQDAVDPIPNTNTPASGIPSYFRSLVQMQKARGAKALDAADPHFLLRNLSH